MKIVGVSIVALFLTAAAFADDKNLNSFQKDELGVLGSIDLQRFDELYRYAQQEGKIRVHINVKELGQTIKNDLSKRADQGKYFAETKRTILKDLGALVTSYTDIAPTMPDMFMVVRPGALLMILNDSRIYFFSLIKNRLFETFNVKMSAAGNALPDCDSSIIAVERPPFRFPVGPVDTGEGGYVVLTYTVEMDGSVSDVSVIETEPPRKFTRNAMSRLYRSQFSKPAVPCRNFEWIEYELE